MKKILLLILAVLSLASFVPGLVLASSASVYISPSSSSVTKGSKVTVKVRVSSGSNRVDSVQARINFTSSKLQYYSYSAGAYSTLTTSKTSSSFEYVGAKLGSYTQNDQVIFSITFKASATGTAYLSLSGVQIYYSGSPLSVSTSGGTVSIKSATTSAPKTSDPKTDTSDGTSSSTEEEQKDPPKLSGTPKVSKTKNAITVSLSCNVDCKVESSYKTGKETAKTLKSSDLKKDHQLIYGQSSPLQPGTIYSISLVLTDDDGNKSKASTISERTTGLDYEAKITDQEGKPLINHKVTLHSDPIEATTDSNGVVKFSDVTPGEHTLVFEIDQLSFNRTVQVTPEAAEAGSDGLVKDQLTLPVNFASAAGTPSSAQNWQTLLAAAVGGAVIASVFKFRYLRTVTGAIARLLGKSKTAVKKT